MPNKRDPNKIRVQTWVSKEDKKALEAYGIKSETTDTFKVAFKFTPEAQS